MRCNCENSNCKRGHKDGECDRRARIPTTGGSICPGCAEYMPLEYLLSSDTPKEMVPIFPEELQVASAFLVSSGDMRVNAVIVSVKLADYLPIIRYAFPRDIAQELGVKLLQAVDAIDGRWEGGV